MNDVSQRSLSQPIFETVLCYYCASRSWREFISAQDDLTGKPGDFSFVACNDCGLVYQNPRIDVENIKQFYDDEYIAHRKKTDWGLLTRLYDRAMRQHDRRKAAIIRRYVVLTPNSEVLDVGCGAGTFLTMVRNRYGAKTTGVDFKDLSSLPGFDQIDFHCGLFYEQEMGEKRFDLITMWHFLEHDYDPFRTLKKAHSSLKADGRLVIEVPRLDSMTYRLYRERWPGLQAPQHTVLYSKEMLLRLLEKAGFDMVDYLPYGAFPAYFYIFAGLAFKILKGRGLDLSVAIYPYFLGQIVLSPLLLFERQLNLAMQTVACRRVK
jgi:2-polyprenyl-3-methyl-5-hydroxy-6-metoxy-1,4-benzoquinol methylase